MFGIVRPCSHRLGGGLLAEWTAHLCGLCLALRADHGQFARVATNYDGLLISVLTEAQSERAAGARRTAGPCPLRAMRTAPVARGEGARLAAAVSLVLASAKVRDHVADRDGLLARRPVAAAARRVAHRWDAAGARTGRELGFDTAVLLDAVDRQTGVEALARPGTPLTAVTEPTETATAAAFAHTAVLAGRLGNAAPLAEAGRLFGRLAHLLDAVEDLDADTASGAWNPITATGTPLAEARRLADDAVHGVRLALADVEFVDDRLAHRLLVHELRRSVDRAFATTTCAHRGHGAPGSPYGHPRQGGGRPRGAYGSHPYGGGGPTGSGGSGGSGGRGFGGGGAEQKPPRGFLAGCAVFVGLFCTCRICCAKEYEGPWSRKKREGCCRDCDGNCSCDCCCPCDGC
ncbi:DUF5685 family protein [Streptomyces sudanensis]|uniref:DUF5685 family protein n=1 Tax=Streptomyces sudanensis TaxID=436397 RepID=UPI0020CEE3C5|nr:DUF5685 family protein [Streptomyces sudanensis]MCP9959544.1 DUF5685 family protein [Streptomyces sudanensis]MCQ0000019.1 DUF5685 family protein [Streptomyces sudanensis]